MNSDVKQRWVERLRNGNIQQGRLKLGYPDGRRCCLGVLCDIAVEDAVISPPITSLSYSGVECLKYAGEYNYLPYKVMLWAGLYNNMANASSGESPSTMNDNSRNFSEIADIIEKHL